MIDPQQTAQDLRRAAELVRQHGFAREEYINPHGNLCAVGAINVATGYMNRIQISPTTYDFSHASKSYYDALDDLRERSAAATQALAPLLPTDCGDAPCGDVHSDFADNPRVRVFHYNDYICEGGEELITLLTQAAEKLEADLP